jgi:hypothetical protein
MAEEDYKNPVRLVGEDSRLLGYEAATWCNRILTVLRTYRIILFAEDSLILDNKERTFL